MTAVHTAQRLMLATGLAICIGLPILACTGSTTTTDTPTDAVVAPTPEPPAADPAARLVGTWRMMPPEDKLRQMKVISAAIAEKPAQKEKQLEKLGKLNADEQKLFNEWEKKSGPEVKAIKQEIRFSKNTNFEFTDKQVTIRFGEDDVNGPFNYSVVSATDSNTTVTFDPGFGNGVETHSFDWTSPTEGVDNISGSSGQIFFPLTVKKGN